MPAFKRQKRSEEERAAREAATAGAEPESAEVEAQSHALNAADDAAAAEENQGTVTVGDEPVEPVALPAPDWALVETGETVTTHAHKQSEHDHPNGNRPHTHEPPETPDQTIAGAGPDAADDTPAWERGYTAPFGTGGFTLVQHVKCVTPEVYDRYSREGADVLPEACRRGHPPVA